MKLGGTIGETTLPAHLAPLLKQKAEALVDMLENDGLWSDLGPVSR